MEDNILLKIISEYKDFNCDFIINTKEYKDLDNMFKSFFGSPFEYKKLIKLNYKSYIYDKYIIKFKTINIPEDILDSEELAKTYIKKNYEIHNKDRVLYLGIEIQDYIIKDDDVTEFDLENIWLSLYNKGYMWADAKLNNIIKRKNKVYIIDSDYIYKINNYNAENESKYSRYFRVKYMINKK